jgi:hypothetical protein
MMGRNTSFCFKFGRAVWQIFDVEFFYSLLKDNQHFSGPNLVYLEKETHQVVCGKRCL